MSVLFTPLKLGDLEIKNRFVHAGTYEVMADENGFVTDQLLKRYKNLSKGEVGMIIPGYMNVHPKGKATPHQTCVDSDDKIPGLKRLADVIHENGSKARAGIYLVYVRIFNAKGEVRRFRGTCILSP